MMTINKAAHLLSGAALLLLSFGLSACNTYKDQAIATVRQNAGDIQTCRNDAEARKPGLKGAMELALEVAPNGKINRIGWSKDEVKDPQLADCIKDKATNWQLPPPPSGKMEQFTYKFRIGQ